MKSQPMKYLHTKLCRTALEKHQAVDLTWEDFYSFNTDQ